MGEDQIERILEQALLYDFYGELLTKHQKEIYEEVVLEDYSLSEVAQEHGISRQGVYDMIRRCNKILAGYEEKLHLMEKFLRAKKRVEVLHALVLEFQKNPSNAAIERICRASDEILKEF